MRSHKQHNFFLLESIVNRIARGEGQLEICSVVCRRQKHVMECQVYLYCTCGAYSTQVFDTLKVFFRFILVQGD